MSMTQFGNKLHAAKETVLSDLREVPDDAKKITVSKCRLLHVGDLADYTTERGIRGQLFSFIIADTHGIADGVCYDGSSRMMFVNCLGKIMKISNMYSKPMDYANAKFQRSLNRNLRQASKWVGIVKLNVEDYSIPKDGEVDASWMLDDETRAQRLTTLFPGGDPRNAAKGRMTASRSNSDRTAWSPPVKLCCSNPDGDICRKTGEPHPEKPKVCIFCQCQILPEEPFCSAKSRVGKACVPVGPKVLSFEETKEKKRFREGGDEDENEETA